MRDLPELPPDGSAPVPEVVEMSDEDFDRLTNSSSEEFVADGAEEDFVADEDRRTTMQEPPAPRRTTTMQEPRRTNLPTIQVPRRVTVQQDATGEETEEAEPPPGK